MGAVLPWTGQTSDEEVEEDFKNKEEDAKTAAACAFSGFSNYWNRRPHPLASRAAVAWVCGQPHFL